jgi:hypothetical protein
MSWRLVYLGVAMAALANGGCLAAALGGVAAAGGVAGYAYYKGGLAQEFNGDLDTSWAATKASLQELGLPVSVEKREKAGGSIDSRTGDGQAIRISFTSITPRIPAEGPRTDISVRVGLFGDRATSDRILAQLSAHMSPVAPPVVAKGETPPPTPQETGPPPIK